VTDFPVKDQVAGTPYEKMKLKPGDREKIERRAKINKVKPRRIDVDESASSLRLLARKLVEYYRDGR
jgi:hypothetical protein